MLKLKITAEQYNRILLHEQTTRLSEASALINETPVDSSKVLTEGLKNVVLAISLISGLRLSGLNKANAENAVKKDKIIASVKATLEDEIKLQELSKALEEKGLKHPDEWLANNATKLVDDFNKTSTANKLKYRIGARALVLLKAMGATQK